MKYSIKSTLVAKENGKYGFKIPISWMVSDYIIVQANTFEEALKYCDDNFDKLPLGDDPQYIDGSYDIDKLFAEELINEKVTYDEWN